MSLRLQQDGGIGLDLVSGTVVSVGRALECDFSVADSTVSRRHAELRVEEEWVAVRDLESANGVRINGANVVEGRVLPGDTIAFGQVTCRLVDSGVPPTIVAATPISLSDLPEGTVVRSHAVRQIGEAQTLARLLDLARRLSGEFALDRVLTEVVEMVFDLLPVDRVSILLSSDIDGADPIPTVTRSRVGDASATRVPRAILWRALADRLPVVTENPAADIHLRSASVVLQSVRKAVCVPLLASADEVVGALYADSLTNDTPFTPADVDTLFALAGLAAVSVGKIRFAGRLQREAATRAAFERYFAPDVAAAIAQQGVTGPTGERRIVTVLFSDIRAFTTLAEQVSPDALAELLTEYFTVIADLVFAHGGTLDKFIGDGILAVWGAPQTGEDDTRRAIAAAQAMQQALATVNARRLAAALPTYAVGIGLSRGEVFAGTIGAGRRLDYTVIGDVVNTASRLAGHAGPADILLTGAVRDDLNPIPALALVPDLTLKGKSDAVAVYRLTEPAGQPPKR